MSPIYRTTWSVILRSVNFSSAVFRSPPPPLSYKYSAYEQWLEFFPAFLLTKIATFTVLIGITRMRIEEP